MARPKARVPTWRGSMLSASTRTISVMPQSSIRGKPKRASNGAVQLGLDAGADAEPHVVRARRRWAAELSSSGAMTPR